MTTTNDCPECGGAGCQACIGAPKRPARNLPAPIPGDAPPPGVRGRGRCDDCGLWYDVAYLHAVSTPGNGQVCDGCQAQREAQGRADELRAFAALVRSDTLIPAPPNCPPAIAPGDTPPVKGGATAPRYPGVEVRVVNRSPIAVREGGGHGAALSGGRGPGGEPLAHRGRCHGRARATPGGPRWRR